MSSTGRGAASLPLPFAPSPLPFDLRAAKSRRISAESAPGLTPIRLVSQLFGRTRPLGRLSRRSRRVPSQLTFYWTSAWPSPAGSARGAPLTRRRAARRPLNGHRANQAARVPRQAAERRLAERPRSVARRCAHDAPWSGRLRVKTRRPRALMPPPATGRSNSERRCLRRKRGRTVSQGRLLIVELWASQAPGSHGPQRERTAC